MGPKHREELIAGETDPSQRLNLSATSLSWPAMWEVDTSTLDFEIKRLSFSRNNANGIEVENKRFDELSAAVLSERVEIRMGIRKPGCMRITMKTKAI